MKETQGNKSHQNRKIRAKSGQIYENKKNQRKIRANRKNEGKLGKNQCTLKNQGNWSPSPFKTQKFKLGNIQAASKINSNTNNRETGYNFAYNTTYLVST